MNMFGDAPHFLKDGGCRQRKGNFMQASIFLVKSNKSKNTNINTSVELENKIFKN